MYNSSIGLNRDDLTMINHSFLYDHNDEPTTTDMPVSRRSQQTNRTTSDGKQDYVLIDQDPLGTAKQIERILNYYRQELKQESTTQLNCNQKLVTRLIDFIRPAYSSHKQKMNDLDTLYEDISTLHDEKCLDQKEKTEQLHNEIAHLKKLIISVANEDDTGRNTMTKIYRIDSMVNYEQWMEMEEETKRLHNLVEIQWERINELIKLISKEENFPFPPSASATIIPPTNQVPIDNQQSTTSKTDAKSTLVDRVRALADQQQATESLVDTENSETPIDRRTTATALTLPALSRLSSYNNKSCCICNHNFVSTANEFEILSHVDKCLSAMGIDDSNEPKQYQCPNCPRQFPGDDEKAYLEHVTDCLSEPVETF